MAIVNEDRSWSSWNPLKPFGRERSEVVATLRAALDGTIDPRAWGNFVDIPMKGTPELERVRVECEALARNEAERMDCEGRIVFTDSARELLTTLLKRLEA